MMVPVAVERVVCACIDALTIICGALMIPYGLLS